MNKNLRDKFYSYFVNKHGAFEYRRGWLRVPICLFCGKDEKLGVNILGNRVNCFVCGSHGDLTQAVKKIEGISTYSDVMKSISDYPDLVYKPKKFDPPDPTELILPPSFVNIAFGTQEGAQARAYMLGRGFNIEHISRRGLGYVLDPKDPHYNHIIIPFYQGDRLVYFQARRYLGRGPKYNNPPFESFGVGRNTILYNMDALNAHHEIHILEGALNAIVMGSNAIALGSKRASTWQISQLVKSPVGIFNILLDSDATEFSIGLAITLISTGKEVRVVIFKDNRDPADLGFKVVSTMVYTSPLLTNFNQIFSLKNELNHSVRSSKKPV